VIICFFLFYISVIIFYAEHIVTRVYNNEYIVINGIDDIVIILLLNYGIKINGFFFFIVLVLNLAVKPQ